MSTRESDLALLKLLSARLERLPVDSHWSHRASGIRGQVLRALDMLESEQGNADLDLRPLIWAAIEILSKAAREIS